MITKTKLTAKEKRYEELLDEMYDSLDKIVRYYKGIMQELAYETYTPEKAEKDYEVLFHTEGLDFLGVLGDYINVEDDFADEQDR